MKSLQRKSFSRSLPEEACRCWNETRAPYPRDKGVHHLFLEQAGRTPSATAVVAEQETLSYAQLSARSRALALRLAGEKVAPETLVPLVLERSAEMVIALLGVLHSGGAYVPLEPELPDERIALLLQDTSARVVLTQARFAERVRRLAGRGVKVMVLDEPPVAPRKKIAKAGRALPKAPSAATARRAAYVIYTSGTTGRPKGVILEHGPLTNRIVWMQRAYGLQPADRILQKTPYSFDVSGWEFFWPLIAGAAVVFARPEGHKDPDYLRDLILRETITTVHFVPSMLRAFLAAPGVAACASLKRVICSGEALPLPLKDQFFRVFPKVELHNLYGPTEAAIDVTAYACRPEDTAVPIGRPVANTRIHILDEALKPVPPGAEGELCIAGECLARGYLNQPELTAQKFVDDPFRRGGKMYRTGDLARWRADGNVEYLGRNDHQIKIRGNRVEPGEIEATLEAQPGVAAAAVVTTGGANEELKLAAYVVPDRGTAPGVFHRTRLAGAGKLEGVALHTLGNGLEVAHLNAGETDFLHREIFERKVYLRHGIRVEDGDCVWDVGANIGMFSIALLTTRRDLRVHAFEPIPDVNRVLAINGELFGGGLTVHPCGLSDAAAETEFTYYPHVSILSGAAANLAGDQATVRAWMLQQHAESLRSAAAEEIDGLIRNRLESRTVRCQLKTLSQAMREQRVEHIDLLKIDVEKMEARVLQGIEDADWPKIRQIVLEAHDVAGRVEQITAQLRQRGFEVVAEPDEDLGASRVFQVYARRAKRATVAAAMTPAPTVESWQGPGAWGRRWREALRAKLPACMEPNFIVPLTDLPLTPSGKVDRKALTQRPTTVPRVRSQALPRSVIEARLIDLWEELLGVVGVGVDDRFFELGGNSLLAVRAAERISREFGTRFSVVMMLELATVRAIATRLAAGQAPSSAAIVIEPAAPAPATDLAKADAGLAALEKALQRQPSIRDSVVVRRRDANGEALIAYAIPDERYFAAQRKALGVGERLKQWISVWERNYQPILEGEASSAERLNAIGYVRSDAGEKIPEAELRECIDSVVEQIMEQRPKTLLEIGCGTGMLLFELAPRVGRYLATDLSENAIAHIRTSLADQPFRERVTCYRCDASELSAVPVEEADTVMVNSVIQYFPGIDYLAQLIETLTRRLPRRARIFIGDVRDLRLLKAFHIWTLLRQCPPTTSKRRFRQLLLDRIKLEKELVIHPQFFQRLREQSPRIRQVRIKPKTGRFPNEFIRFRYDVVLHLDEAPPEQTTAPVQPWNSRGRPLDEALDAAALAAGGSSPLYVSGIPNRRLWRENAIAEWLRQPGQSAPLSEVLGRLEDQAANAAGADPAACLRWAAAQGKRASLHWENEADDGRFDLFVRPAGAAGEIWPAITGPGGGVRAPERLNNLPTFSLDWEAHLPVLKQALRDALPGVALPARFIFTPEFPRLDNGEIDREALAGPKPEASGPAPAAPGSAGAGDAVAAGGPEYYDTSLAIIGISGVFPGAANAGELWENLRGGVESIRFHTDAELAAAGVPEPRRRHPRFVAVRAGIAGAANFDAAFFKIPPAQAANMDPQARLLLQHAWRAIEDAGYAPRSIPQTAVYLSAGNNFYPQALGLTERELQGIDGHEAGQFGQPGMIPSWVSYHLGLKGPSLFVQSLCCSSLSSLHLAYRSLLAGDVDQALVGAANVFAPDRIGYLHEPDMNLSADGHCRSFDAAANGMVEGEGACVILVKRARDAVRDRDPIYAVLRGIGVSNDGADKAGFHAPSLGGQTDAIRRAFAAARVPAASIRYLEAHGTGTPLGDSIELAALRESYGGDSAGAGTCGIGSTKPNIGNLDTVTGLVGCVKLALSLRRGEFPPVVHFRAPHPDLRLDDSPFYIVPRAEAWPRAGQLRRAAQHVYSLGGTNAHAIYEEFPAPVRQVDPPRGPVLVPLSARSRERLRASAGELLRFMETPAAPPSSAQAEWLVDLAYTLQVGREPMEHRVLFAPQDWADLRRMLAEFAGGAERVAGARGGEVARAQDLRQLLGDEAERRRFAAQHVAEARWDRVAELWVRGVEIEWRALYGARPPYRLNLPGYPFEASACGLRRATVTSVATPIPLPMPPAPAAVSSDLPGSSDGLERVVRAAVGALLGLPADSLAAEETFGDLGMDSTHLIRLTNRLNQEQALTLTPAVLFEHATIGRLAAHLAQQVVATRASAGVGGGTVPVARSQAAESIRADGAPAGGRDGIAIVGLSGKFPQAADVGAFWKNLVAGRDCISEVPADRWSWQEYYGDPNEDPRKTKVKWGGFIDGLAEFDPLFFNLSPGEAEAMDPQNRLLMMHVWLAMEDAGYAAASLAGTRTGLFLGTSESGYARLLAAEKDHLDYGFLGVYPFGGPNRMSYFLNVTGPSEPINTGCSSSLIAVHKAVRALEAGECDFAFAGGVNAVPTPDGHISFSRYGMLCEDGRCKAFSSEANGFVRGEGVGIVMLKRLRDAERDGDHIEGVIIGSAENHGGRSNSFTAPNPAAQAGLIGAALRRAAIDPASIGYVEAHGTGTKLGDPVELAGLKQAFGVSSRAGPRNSCGVGSVKSNIGHLESAAGIAGLIKALLQLKHGTLVRTLHCPTISPLLQIEEGPFYIVRENRPWDPPADASGRVLPRRAGVSSFGIGGVNAHVVLEEYVAGVDVQEDSSGGSDGTRVVVLSAKTDDALRQRAQQLLAHLRAHPVRSRREFHDLVATLQFGRDAMDERLAVLARDPASLESALENWLAGRAGAGGFRGRAGQPAPSRQPAGEAAVLAGESGSAAIAEAWVRGESIDWQRVQGGARWRRVSLPGYPFARDRYWAGARADEVGARIAPPGPVGATPHRGGETPPVNWSGRLRERSHERILVISADDTERDAFCDRLRRMSEAAGLDAPLRLEAIHAGAISVGPWGEERDTLFVLRSAASPGAIAHLHERIRRAMASADVQVLALPAGAIATDFDHGGNGRHAWTLVETEAGADAETAHQLLLREWLWDGAGARGTGGVRVVKFEGAQRLVRSLPAPAPRVSQLVEKHWQPQPLAAPASAPLDGGTLFLVNEDSVALVPAFGCERALVVGDHRVPRSAANFLVDFRDAGAGLAAAAAIAVAGEGVSRVIDLSDLYREPRAHDDEKLGKIVIYQTLVGRFADCAIGHVTQGLLPFASERMSLAGAKFAGLVRMLGAEYGHIRAKTIDLDAVGWTQPDWLAGMLDAELRGSGGETEVCYRAGVRHAPQLIAAVVATEPVDFRVDADAVYLISGGTRGIGLEIARHLVAKGARKLALLGIQALSPRAEWERRLARPDLAPGERARLAPLLELSRAVDELRIHTAPLTERAALRQFVEEIRSNVGRIAGVVHSAGAYPEGNAAPFVTREVAQMRRVLEPKLAGLEALHELFADSPPEFFVSFSSLTGVIPRLARGMSDYAMANAYLDYFAAYQFQQEKRQHYRSITWVDWKETGFAARMSAEQTARLDAELESLGLAAFSNHDGRRFFDLAMGLADRSWSLPCFLAPVAFEAARPSLLTVGANGCPGGASCAGRPALDLARLDRSLAGWEKTVTAGVPLAPEELQAVIALDEVKRLDPARVGRIYQLLFPTEAPAPVSRRESAGPGIADQVRRHLFDVLKIKHVDDQKPFQDYGLDSISAMVFSNRLEKEIKRTVPPAWLIDFPTVEMLSLHLEQQLGERSRRTGA